VPYVDLLVNMSYLGINAFTSTMSALCQIGAPDFYHDLTKSKITEGCYTCVRDRMKKLQEHMRGQRPCQQSYPEQFSWQYAFQMLGRLDHPWFVDTDDFEARLDFEKLKQIGQYGELTDKYEERFTAAIIKRGTEFGAGIHCQSETKMTTALPEFSFLSSVAAGSVEKKYIPEAAIEEIELSAMNKKLTFAYMSRKQAKQFSKVGELHSRSRVSTKKELVAMRNLLPGSMGCYYWSCIVSAFGETSFLNKQHHTPIMYSAEQLTRRMASIRAKAGEGFVSCRDYANYNVAHKHSDIIAFYQAIHDGLPAHTNQMIRQSVLNLIECMREVSVHTADATYLWEHGLMSGWRHTMLINTIFNDAIADVANQMATEELGTRTLDYLVQGDDTLELHNSPLAAPWIQGLLDTAGRVGKASKQIMGGDPDGNFEFLRMYYTKAGVQGSAPRAACSFACPDTQKPEMRGGIDITAALNDSLNTIYRRTNYPTLRPEDVVSFSTYWAQQGERTNARTITKDMLFSPITTGGIGMVHPLVQPSTQTYTVESRLEQKTCVKSDKRLERIIKGKINDIAPRIDLREYAGSYTKDVLTTALKKERIFDFGIDVTQDKSMDYGFQAVVGLNDTLRKQVLADATTSLSGANKGLSFVRGDTHMDCERTGSADICDEQHISTTITQPHMNDDNNLKACKYDCKNKNVYNVNIKNQSYKNKYNMDHDAKRHGSKPSTICRDPSRLHTNTKPKLLYKYETSTPTTCNDYYPKRLYERKGSKMVQQVQHHIVAPAQAQAMLIANNIIHGTGEDNDVDERCVMRVVSEFFGGSRTTAHAYIMDRGIPPITEDRNTTFSLSRGFELLLKPAPITHAKAWHVQAIPSLYARHISAPDRATNCTPVIQWYKQMCVANIMRAEGQLY
jgi:hypothetical protein